MCEPKLRVLSLPPCQKSISPLQTTWVKGEGWAYQDSSHLGHKLPHNRGCLRASGVCTCARNDHLRAHVWLPNTCHDDARADTNLLGAIGEALLVKLLSLLRRGAIMPIAARVSNY